MECCGQGGYLGSSWSCQGRLDLLETAAVRLRQAIRLESEFFGLIERSSGCCQLLC